MTFGESFVWYKPFLFPSPHVHDFSILAPFFFDVDTSKSGSITYEVHTGGEVLDFVSAFVTKEEGISFKANWMLLVYWDEVPAYGSPNHQVC